MSTQTFHGEFRDPNTLKPHPDNPRGEIDTSDPALLELAASLASNGMIEPIVTTSTGHVLAGHRRRAAAIIAGIEVPVIIRDLQPGEFPEDFFIAENKHRQDLSALEEARAYARLLKRLSSKKVKVTIQDLSRRLDIPGVTVRSRLNILRLPARVQLLFHNASVPINSSTQLCRLLEWPEEIEKFADRMATRNITLNSLDALITRRIQVLRAETDTKARIELQPRLDSIRKKHHPEGIGTPVLTRKVAMENLNNNLAHTISLHTIRAVLDSTCCTCGMMGEEKVCVSCPLPRFVNGIVGRSIKESADA